MDAATNKHRQDRQSCRSAVWIAVLLAFIQLGSVSIAQDASVSPELESLNISHSMTEGIQAFPAARWDIFNSGFRDGCVVQWSLAPFQHEANPSLVIDSDISLRMVRSGNSSRWRTTSDYDDTRVASGKNTALVGVTSSRRGNGVAELTVRFRSPQLSQLAAGKYHTTLIGTISGL